MPRLIDSALIAPTLPWPGRSVKGLVTHGADLPGFPPAGSGCSLSSHLASVWRNKGEHFLRHVHGADAPLKVKFLAWTSVSVKSRTRQITA